VPDDQLSLAIGKDGLNARLAARLTGWRVDIRSETEFAEDESEMGYAEEDVSGRCAAILANGKRCPNASLPGSRYCGLPAHQALEGTGTDFLVPPEDEGASSDNGDLPVEDLVEAVADAPVASEDAPVASADQPLDEEPVADAEPVPEDPPADPEAEPSAGADDPELDEEPEADTATPDVSAADEEAEES
jgi:N utilization substance protein A